MRNIASDGIVGKVQDLIRHYVNILDGGDGETLSWTKRCSGLLRVSFSFTGVLEVFCS